MLIYTNRARY